jgi:DNA polymerase (family X)
MLRAHQVAALLREIADALALDQEPHRSRAYARAARSLDGVADLDRLVAERRLTELPGVGRSLEGVIAELWSRGTIALLERLRERWPKVLAELARLPRIGPERARTIYDALRPESLAQVEELCAAGRIRLLPGFGPSTEARLADAIRRRDEVRTELTLEDATELTAALARSVRAIAAVQDVVAAGPPRRWMETADHVALAVASDAPAAVLDELRRHAAVATLAYDGGGGARGRLTSGVGLEVHVAPRARFGLALLRATGSAEHVAALDRHAAARGIALDEMVAPDEAALYAALGLPLLPPEVRDGSDEIAAALAGDDFADLVRLEDLRGAVHCHTTYSDGSGTIAEMADAAAAHGLEYLTITDHSQGAGYAGGLTPERLREQWDEIARVQATTPVRLLRGTESDILPDGGLDYPDPILAELDVVIASIHKRHKLDEDGMTRRVVAALRQPVFKIWGHALGRIILHRDPIAVRFDEVLDALAASRVAVEINGDPRRLDLEPALARRARERGVPFVLSSDAHAPAQLGHLDFAVGMARRARIRRREVLNALSADDFARAVRPGAA